MNSWNFDSAAYLLSRDIPPQRWIVEKMLPEGLTLLCGAPKAGKSWLALDIALHVASGMPFWNHPTSAGRVLYLALEDGERRLKARIETLIASSDGLEPGQLYPCFSVPPIEQGFAAELDNELRGEHDRIIMVVIDTLGRVREPSRLDGYQRDYAQLAELKKVADKHHIALLVVHHLRKMKSDDPFDMISGTQGILGAADGAFVLRRNSRTDRNGKLFFTGRDADDQQYAVQFGEDCRWNLLSADAEQFDFMRLPLVQFLQQLVTPWTGFASEIAADYIDFCRNNGLDAGLSLTAAGASIGRKLTAISGDLWRLRLSYSTRHTSKGNLMQIDRL